MKPRPGIPPYTVRLLTGKPPAYCDFCGALFGAPRWNCRTCPTCARSGMPDQSTTPPAAYARAVVRWSRAHRPDRAWHPAAFYKKPSSGRRPLSKRPLSPRRMPQDRKTPPPSTPGLTPRSRKGR